MNKATLLRELFRKDALIMAPGAYDAWSARLVENAGFSCVYMTGYGVSASVLGKPDIGLISFSEMVQAARNVVAAVNVPVVADADNGYGGTLNVVRTVQAYEQAGVAAIQLEDQVTPKRCGHMEGKEVISKDEMVAKIRAAVHARQHPDFMIIARTDARAVNGYDDALDRARAYEEAGADILFVEAPQSIEEMRGLHQALSRPLLANMVEKGKTPVLTAKELHDLGFKIAIYPVSALYCVTKSLMKLYADLKRDETTSTLMDQMTDFPTFNRLIQVQEHRDLERSFLSDCKK